MMGGKKKNYTQGTERVNSDARFEGWWGIGVSGWHFDIPPTPHTFTGSEQSSLDAVMYMMSGMNWGWCTTFSVPVKRE